LDDAANNEYCVGKTFDGVEIAAHFIDEIERRIALGHVQFSI
jgi:hypothetical protein